MAFRDKPYVVTPSGSCASMVRVFYPELLRDDPELLREAKEIGPRVYELSEFIVGVLGVTDLAGYSDNAEDAPTIKVTYHEACHLRRELGVTTQPRTLIRSVPGTELVEMGQAEVCCGFGGTFSIKYPDISGAMLRDKIGFVRDTGAGAVISCDSTCLMQIAGGLQREQVPVRAMHLAQLIDEGLS
jgi:L-lactate dehydrogenase complex protein LldE